MRETRGSRDRSRLERRGRRASCLSPRRSARWSESGEEVPHSRLLVALRSPPRSRGSRYGYRLFAQYDTSRDWSELIDTTYFLLETNSGLTDTGLPSDWLLLDKRSGSLRLGSEEDSRYSYDAFRTHWRVALDSVLFNEPRAHAYLQRSLVWLVDRFRKEGTLPASISPRGDPLAEYESLEMLSGVMPAMKDVAPDVAHAMNERLKASLAEGLWGDRESYYLQNWAWFGTALYWRNLTPFEALRGSETKGAVASPRRPAFAAR